MTALKDMVPNPENLLSASQKKTFHEGHLYEKVDLPRVEKKTLLWETGAPSRKTLKNLLNQDFGLTIRTVKESQKNELKKALEALDVSDILATIEHTPSLSQNQNVVHLTKKIDKILEPSLQELDVQEFAAGLPNFANKKIEERIYMGVVSHGDKDGFTVCIGKVGDIPLEYNFLAKDATFFGADIKFSKGNTAFVDVKKDSYALSNSFAFNKSRKEALEKMGIEINGNKPIYYMTRGGKTFKGKVVEFGDDVTGQQIIFETKEGKKFPLSVENLKKWINLAREHYKNSQNKNTDGKRPKLIVRVDKKVA